MNLNALYGDVFFTEFKYDFFNEILYTVPVWIRVTSTILVTPSLRQAHGIKVTKS